MASSTLFFTHAMMSLQCWRYSYHFTGRKDCCFADTQLSPASRIRHCPACRQTCPVQPAWQQAYLLRWRTPFYRALDVHTCAVQQTMIMSWHCECIYWGGQSSRCVKLIDTSYRSRSIASLSVSVRAVVQHTHARAPNCKQSLNPPWLATWPKC